MKKNIARTSLIAVAGAASLMTGTVTATILAPSAVSAESSKITLNGTTLYEQTSDGKADESKPISKDGLKQLTGKDTKDIMVRYSFTIPGDSKVGDTIDFTHNYGKSTKELPSQFLDAVNKETKNVEFSQKGTPEKATVTMKVTGSEGSDRVAHVDLPSTLTADEVAGFINGLPADAPAPAPEKPSDSSSTSSTSTSPSSSDNAKPTDSSKPTGSDSAKPSGSDAAKPSDGKDSGNTDSTDIEKTGDNKPGDTDSTDTEGNSDSDSDSTNTDDTSSDDGMTDTTDDNSADALPSQPNIPDPNFGVVDGVTNNTSGNNNDAQPASQGSDNEDQYNGFTDNSKKNNPQWRKSSGGESISVDDDKKGPEVKTGGEGESQSFFDKIKELFS